MTVNMLFDLFDFLYLPLYVMNLCIHSYSASKLTIKMVHVHIVLHGHSYANI